MAMNMVWGIESEEDYMDYEDIDLSDEVVPQDLFPGLPEEIAMECLLRVAPSAFPQVQEVCKRWGELVTAKEFYEARRRVGTTQNCVCIVQAEPEVQPEHGVKHQSPPVFGVSTYDIGRGNWGRLPPVPDFHDGLPIFCRIVGLCGKLMLIGGWHPTTYEALKSVFMYDFFRQSWKRCADMPASRSFFACGVIGSRVYIAGGHDDNKNALASADVYVPEEDRWEALPAMSEGRDECGGAVVNGKLAIVSGYSTRAQGQFVASAELFDPEAAAWMKVENMWPDGMAPAHLAVHRQQLYAVHGRNLVRYSAESNSWTAIDVLPEADRTPTCATSICDSLVLMSLPSSGDPHKSLVHRKEFQLQEGARWEVVRQVGEFSGLGRACCAVEI